MEKQKAQSGKKMSDPLDHVALPDSVQTEFTGYDELETPSKVNALVQNEKAVDTVKAGTECYVIMQKAPFFIVGGGQVPDQGWLQFGDAKQAISQARYINGRIAVKIKAPVDITVGDAAVSIVDPVWRTNAMKNHTATHLLQAALMQLFGKHIKQSGSLVHPDYLRFDFTYHKNLTAAEIKQVEDLVNAKIRENIPVSIEYMEFKKAIDKGVLAFFGEKYNPENVRVVNVPEFSMELCGGTHVHRTGDIGTFKITDCSSISAGHKRIVALTGPRALELFQETFATTKNLSQHFNIKREDVEMFVDKQTQELKNVQKQIKQLKQQVWQAQAEHWLNQVETHNGVPFLFLSIANAAHDEMRAITQLLQEKKPGLYLLVSPVENRTAFLTSLHPTLDDTVNLKNFGSWLKDELGLRGGGSKGTLQGAGGKFDSKWKEAIIEWLKK